jgi:hypothetical protein
MTRRKTVFMSILVVGLTASAVATASGPVEIHKGGDIHEGVGQPGPKTYLQRGVTYAASAFPLAVRIRPPDGRWGGVQLESGTFRFVQLNHLRTGTTPLHGVGYVTLEASARPTGSVERTVGRLRSTPHLDVGPSKAVRVAGLAGTAFDATVVGSDNPPVCKHHRCAKGVSFAPFGPNRHCGFCNMTMHGETQDVKFAGQGQLFRIIVLGVRGTTVVIYLESAYVGSRRHPPAETFPTFLPFAERMLAALRFPAT